MYGSYKQEQVQKSNIKETGVTKESLKISSTVNLFPTCISSHIFVCPTKVRTVPKIFSWDYIQSIVHLIYAHVKMLNYYDQQPLSYNVKIWSKKVSL